MQNSPIYNHRAELTPSQRDAARQRAARLRRIGSRARPEAPVALRREADPIPVEDPAELPEVVDRDLLFSLWVERQRQKHAEDAARFAVRATLSEGKRPAVELIQKIVAKHFGFEWRIMFTAARTANVVRPRQIAMYLAKTMAEKSLPDIGRRFGGRDHTTVLHAVRRVAALVEQDQAIAADVANLKTMIEAKLP